jgi:hypothetical protein
VVAVSFHAGEGLGQVLDAQQVRALCMRARQRRLGSDLRLTTSHYFES